MKSERSISGWIAALTVTAMLTLTLLVVDKHLLKSKQGIWQLARQSEYTRWLSTLSGLSGDGLAVRDGAARDLERIAPPPHTPNRIASTSSASRRSDQAESGISDLLRRPPEPASGAVLREPLTPEDFVTLPLTQGVSSVSMLMETMEAALESPIRTVGMRRSEEVEQATTSPSQTPPPTTTAQPVPSALQAPTAQSDLAALSESPGVQALRRMPTEWNQLLPQPTQLMQELEQLRTSLSVASREHASTEHAITKDASTEHARTHGQPQLGSMPQLGDTEAPHYVGLRNSPEQPFLDAQSWLEETSRLIHLMTTEEGLESLGSRSVLERLIHLSAQGIPLGEKLPSDQVGPMVIRTAYSVQRRVEVWQAIQQCLADAPGQETSNTNAEEAISQLKAAIEDVENLLAQSSDRKLWRTFFLLDELQQWTQSSREEWRVDNQLAKKYLSRVRSHTLDEAQQRFLQHEKILRLTGLLSAWNRDPIDYRHLLASIEQVEQSAPSRLVSQVAGTIQTLAHSPQSSQQKLAEAINRHYRNANLRMTISRDLVEKFLPEGQYEVRPVRKTILGAQTSGDSAVKTQLSVRFQPDPHNWNMELGVVGDLVSNTSSSKGPAIFHNTGVARVESRRYLKIGRDGYSISSSPTEVASQDYLNRMSTDFDGLPIIGDFVRLIAREQFNQKRGIAKRITQRIIAQETDTELDRKLEEGLKQYEQQLQQRILGPLDRLKLDPMVVSLSTTQDRLAVRYRLAHESQLTAFTPRPRAPSGSLLSFQVHQSALNNTIEQIGLSGREWRIAELYQHLGELVQAKLSPPEDVPSDITIRFADREPISFEMADGQLRLTLRIAEFSREEGLSVRNFMVTSSYIPLAEGLDAGLVRDPDGVIEIQGKNLAIRDRLALRVIFAKVFVSKPKISLIAPQWQEDPKAKGLAISQLDLRDGWLAVALSAADSGMAAEVAARSRETRAKLR